MIGGNPPNWTYVIIHSCDFLKSSEVSSSISTDYIEGGLDKGIEIDLCSISGDSSDIIKLCRF